jgi:hypothetical protein
VVEDLYNQKETMPTTDEYLFKSPLETTLNLPTSILHSWVFKVKHRLHRYKQRLAKETRHKLTTHPFFNTSKARSSIKPKTTSKRACHKATTTKKKENHVNSQYHNILPNNKEAR